MTSSASRLQRQRASMPFSKTQSFLSMNQFCYLQQQQVVLEKPASVSPDIMCSVSGRDRKVRSFGDPSTDSSCRPGKNRQSSNGMCSGLRSQTGRILHQTCSSGIRGTQVPVTHVWTHLHDVAQLIRGTSRSAGRARAALCPRHSGCPLSPGGHPPVVLGPGRVVQHHEAASSRPLREEPLVISRPRVFSPRRQQARGSHLGSLVCSSGPRSKGAPPHQGARFVAGSGVVNQAERRRQRPQLKPGRRSEASADRLRRRQARHRRGAPGAPSSFPSRPRTP